MIRSQRVTLLATVVAATTALGVVGSAFAQSPSAAAPASTGYAELDQAMGADQPMKGTKVDIQTQWIGGEGQNFAAAFAPFVAATGIQVQVDQIGSSHETVLKTRIEGNAPPDLAMLAQPSGVIAYGDAGKLIDIATILDPAKLKADHEVSYYSSGDHIWAIPYKVDVKGSIWYPIKAFQAAGYEVPTTWDELTALEAKIVADGNGSPWCIGMNAGTATGWQATDWLEQVVLRQAGPEVYDKWVSHEVKFDSPEITAAMDTLAKMWFTDGYAYGGNTAIVSTPQTQPMDPMFPPDGNWDGFTPGCWMQNQALWYGPDFFPDQRTSGQPSKFIEGEDIGLFVLPPMDPANVPAEVAGDGLMVLQDRPEVRAFAQYLATPQGIEAWVKSGNATAANRSVPLDWYQGYEAEFAANLLANATSVSFDGGDMMPPAVGSGSFWHEMVNWISANGADTQARLQAIDASWPQ
jgi:alpha-glucoside transport system substrate-binding protein